MTTSLLANVLPPWVDLAAGGALGPGVALLLAGVVLLPGAMLLIDRAARDRGLRSYRLAPLAGPTAGAALISGGAGR